MKYTISRDFVAINSQQLAFQGVSCNYIAYYILYTGKIDDCGGHEELRQYPGR